MSPVLLPQMPTNVHPFPGVVFPSVNSRARATNSCEPMSWYRQRRALSCQPRAHQSPAESLPSPTCGLSLVRDISSATTGSQVQAKDSGFNRPYGDVQAVYMDTYGHFPGHPAYVSLPNLGLPPYSPPYDSDWEPEINSRTLPDLEEYDNDTVRTLDNTPEYLIETNNGRASNDNINNNKTKAATTTTNPRYHYQTHRRRSSNRDEFDGPYQLLDPPPPWKIADQEKDLPHLPTNLDVSEQDRILTAVNDRLSQCAFHFVSKYQFPIPLDPDKRLVRVASDREWTEWVYLLKRLATKRRIPARVLYNGQIKQFVTVLESSLDLRHAAVQQSRPVKDDRNVLQIVSAATQVARILKDASAMEFLDRVYVQTEMLIEDGRKRHFKFVLP